MVYCVKWTKPCSRLYPLDARGLLFQPQPDISCRPAYGGWRIGLPSVQRPLQKLTHRRPVINEPWLCRHSPEPDERHLQP